MAVRLPSAGRAATASRGPDSIGRTAGAETVELDTMVRHAEPGSRRDPRVQPSVHGLLEIEDAPAGRAREVVVTTHAGVKANARPMLDLAEEPVAGEQAQVAIDGAKTHVRQPTANAGVHAFGGRVAVRRANDRQDEPPLVGQAQPPPGQLRPERPIGAGQLGCFPALACRTPPRSLSLVRHP